MFQVINQNKQFLLLLMVVAWLLECRFVGVSKNITKTGRTTFLDPLRDVCVQTGPILSHVLYL